MAYSSILVNFIRQIMPKRPPPSKIMRAHLPIRPSNTTLNNTKRHLNNTVIYCHNSVATINNIAKWWFFQNFSKKWRFFQNFEFVLKKFKILKKKLAKNNVFFMAKNDDFFFKISAKLKKSSILLKYWKNLHFLPKFWKNHHFWM